MPSAAQAVRIYQDLADWHQGQGQPQQRDRFLVLAADAAMAAGQGDEAERLRGRLLQLNPHHLLKPYASFAEAMRAGDVQSYVSALRQSHPWEAAERLLASLRIDAPEEPASGPVPEPEPPVFRVRRETDEPKPDPPRPRQAPPPHARAPQAPIPFAQPVVPQASPVKPRSTLPPKTVAHSDSFGLESGSTPMQTRRPRSLEPEEPAVAGSNVLPSILFALLLMAGVALALYTLARPFFPL